MSIIAFTGKRGHGKTTAALVLEEEFDYGHFNFADPLREVCNVAYGVTYDEMNHPVLKEQVLARWPHKSPRELLQQIGTEMFRAYIADTWIENWKMRVREAFSPSSSRADGSYLPPAVGVTCSDCRFLNEAGAVESMGGKLIKIVDPRKERADAASLHQSETEIDLLPVDWIIINDGTIEELRSKVRYAVQTLTEAAA